MSANDNAPPVDKPEAANAKVGHAPVFTALKDKHGPNCIIVGMPMPAVEKMQDGEMIRFSLSPLFGSPLDLIVYIGEHQAECSTRLASLVASGQFIEPRKD